jgi:hypothetical protein
MQKPDPLNWLLEIDGENPGIRYFALQDLLGLPQSDNQVREARSAIMESGPVPKILKAQEPGGFWVKPGGGYSPKYKANAWSLLFLAELGADPDNEQIRLGCEYYLNNSVAENGGFSVYRKPTPSGAFHCLNGNMIFAMQRLGYGEHPLVGSAREWLIQLILDQQQGTSGAGEEGFPGFVCRVNEGKPCAWGANKALRALLETPESAVSPDLERALEAAAAFLLSRDPAAADYPYTGRVSSTWFKLGFPLSYWSDVLETVSNLAALGYGSDPRLTPGLQWIEDKQDQNGRWPLNNSLNGKMWVDIETKKQPSKWVTLRSLRALKLAGLYTPPG